jgi:hypothetical protein
MPLYILLLLIQIGLAIHVAKTGRNLYWIMLIVLVPIVGAAAYFFVEVLPELMGSRGTRRAVRKVRHVLDPKHDQKQVEAQLAVADTVQNRTRLAEECLAHNEFLRAEELFRACLTGPHRNDPNLMLGVARAQFGRGDAAAAKATLDALIAANPDFQSTDGHMLYARSVEAQGDLQAAEKEFAVLAESFPGEEGRARYALLLKRLDKHFDAQRMFEKIIARAKVSPKYYQVANREWIELAREQLRAPG